MKYTRRKVINMEKVYQSYQYCYLTNFLFIYYRELSLPEQLMRNVDRVWYERGDWNDITEEGLQGALAKIGNSKGSTTSTDTLNTQTTDEKSITGKQQTDETTTTTNLMHDHDTTMVDEGKLRESVISKL
jgi:hypothetical protein